MTRPHSIRSLRTGSRPAMTPPVDPAPGTAAGRDVVVDRTKRPAAPTKRRFQFHAKLVRTDAARRIIAGYASTRDMDRAGDVVEPDAFRESLTEYARNPVVTYMHNWADPIGKVTDAVIDDRGLAITAQISRTADKVWALIEEGVLRAFSIGYDVLDERCDGAVNHITKLRLYEVAVVSIPANQHCVFSIGKALRHGTDLLCPACADPLSAGLVLSPAETREACALLESIIVAWPGQAA